MDQVKAFLRQCVKHRFWIAVGISALLPMIGYFLGSGTINEATAKAEAEIKGADTEVKKYTSPGLPNDQYVPIVKAKTESLTKDVGATWQKLFEQQEPLLRWPEVVESRFRAWGRKWPENVDRGVVQQAIYDYTIAYPEFVTKVYKSFNPWNPEDGTGIVVAPDEQLLIKPAPFVPETPPELGKVWAEQERLWVLTALLDVVKNVNEGAKAKDWDGAIIKQISAIQVGTPLAQDQVSIAKGEALEPAVDLYPEGQEAPVAEVDTSNGDPSMMGMMPGGGAAAANAGVVYYIKTDSTQYTSLPVMMTVLVDQNRLQDFLIGLENSPMSIRVMEPELSKPATPVQKPVIGDYQSFGYGMMPGMMPGMEGMMGGRGGYGSDMMGPGSAGMMPGGMEGMGYGGMAPTVRQGKSIRDVDKAKQRAKAIADAKKKKVEKKAVDPYYNVIEVTVYGQARFYNAPPPPAGPEPSASESTPAAEEAAPAAPADAPAPKAEGATPEAPAADTPKADAPADAPAPSPAPTAPQS